MAENDNNCVESVKGSNEVKIRTDKRSFTEALRERYCFDGSDYVFGSSLVTFHGKPGNAGQKAELAHLRNVVLFNSGVAYAGIPNEGLMSLCPNVMDLDLCFNQLTSWKEVLTLFEELPHLKFVNLTYNKIQHDKDQLDLERRPLNVENLVLNYTDISWQEVNRLSRLLPKLKELHLCHNEYKEIGDIEEDAFESVECLRINNNKIQSWSQVWKLRDLQNLKSLVLSGNPIYDVFYDRGCEESSDTTVPQSEPGISVPSSLATRADNCDMTIIDGTKSQSCDTLSSAVSESVQDHKLNIYAENGTDDVESVSANSEPVQTTEGSTSVNPTAPSTDTHPVAEILGTRQNIIAERNFGVDQEEKFERLRRLRLDSIQSEDGDDVTIETTTSDESFTPEDDDTRKPFQNLHSLCLTETSVNHHDHLTALTHFPSLKSVRLRDIPLYQDFCEDEKRMMFLASLPNIQIFNGGEVSETDRENSERFYIRHHVDMDIKPHRAVQLEQKHGKLSKIVDINIGGGYQEYVTVDFYVDGKKDMSKQLCMKNTVGKLRSMLANHLSLSKQWFRMFLFPCSPKHGYMEGEFPEREELLFNIPMSRYNIFDGDEIHVETNVLADDSIKHVVKKNEVKRQSESKGQ